MNRPFSVYLDLVRFIAALLVYMWHSNQRFLTTAILPFSDYGHSAVIVFFVLSGFVIAFITDTRESRLSDYAASRFSRVFSVAVPAIALTLVLDTVGRQLYPEIYNYPYDQFPARVIASLLMANEVWLVSVTSFSNVPYWSISYEWWYYVTFAMVTFLPRKVGLPVAALTMILIGPKVLLLAPVWWAGVLLYRWRRMQDLPVWGSWLLVVLSLLGIGLFHHFQLMRVAEEALGFLIGADLVHSLTFSKRVFADYILAVLVFANFAGMRSILAVKGAGLAAMARPIRLLAGFTFTLYLIHQPLFLFWASVVRGEPDKPWYWMGVTVLTMATVVVVGIFTERRRSGLRRWALGQFRRWDSGRITPAT